MWEGLIFSKKVAIWCGSGDIYYHPSHTIWPLFPNICTPSHNLAIFQAESTLGPDPPPIMPTWPDLGSESAHFVKFWPKFGSDNALFAQCSFKFGLESALFVWCRYLIVSTLLHVVPNPLSIVPTLFNFGQNSFPIRPTLFEIGPIPLRRTSTLHMLVQISFS